MKNIWTAAAWLALLTAVRADAAEASVFRFRTEHGAIRYSNVRPLGTFQVVRPALQTGRAEPAPALRRAPSPPSSPNEMLVPAAVQHDRDRERYQILSDELAWTRQLLQRAQAGRADPALLHRHQVDIEALLRELARTRASMAGASAQRAGPP